MQEINGEKIYWFVVLEWIIEYNFSNQLNAATTSIYATHNMVQHTYIPLKKMMRYIIPAHGREMRFRIFQHTLRRFNAGARTMRLAHLFQ
jgi:hypothetical protein